jgi:hypothetical protein
MKNAACHVYAFVHGSDATIHCDGLHVLDFCEDFWLDKLREKICAEIIAKQGVAIAVDMVTIGSISTLGAVM